MDKLERLVRFWSGNKGNLDPEMPFIRLWDRSKERYERLRRLMIGDIRDLAWSVPIERKLRFNYKLVRLCKHSNGDRIEVVVFVDSLMYLLLLLETFNDNWRIFV